MGTKQLQKTVNALAVTKTAISQKQSLEVVQTMFHGALSTLSYLRHFFLPKAFDGQTWRMSDHIVSYEDYANGRLVEKANTTHAPTIWLRVLRRGRSKRADTFLDWLEGGVFKALKDGTLRALQIYVHPGAIERRKVIEYYTFTVDYVSGPDGSSTPTGLRMDSSSNPTVTVEATNAALHALLEQIKKIGHGLPRLPETKFMSMQMFYRDDVKIPSNLGWVESKSEILMFGESDDWKRHNEELEGYQLGFHRASISIAHLQNMSVDSETGEEMRKFDEIPSSLEYNKTHQKRSDIPPIEFTSNVPCSGNQPEEPDNTTPSTVVESVSAGKLTDWQKRGLGANETPTAARDTSKTIAPDDQPPQSKASARNTVNIFGKTRSRMSLAGKDFDTQSSNVPEMTSTLSGMMQPEQLTQGDTQIQRARRSTRSSASSIQTQNKAALHSKSTELDTTSTGVKLAVLKSTLKSLNDKKHRLRSLARQVAKDRGRNYKDTDLVACQCGCDEEDDAMVFCVYCETWQHMTCCGFTGVDDPRIPENHVCCKCLLGKAEEDTMTEVVKLAKLRRGMFFILQNGLNSQSDSELGTVPSPVKEQLESKGFIVEVKSSKRSGFPASEKVSYMSVQSGRNHLKMLKELFDPLTHIGHHYDIPSKFVFPTAQPSTQLRENQEKAMPAPVTPASKLRKNNQVHSLDLDSPAPQNRPPKRKLLASNKDNDRIEVEEPHPKRRAPQDRDIDRPKCSQTQCMLNINGDISSPAPSLW